eukprot:115673-Amphidinium_carterae.3
MLFKRLYFCTAIRGTCDCAKVAHAHHAFLISQCFFDIGQEGCYWIWAKGYKSGLLKGVRLLPDWFGSKPSA